MFEVIAFESHEDRTERRTAEMITWVPAGPEERVEIMGRAAEPGYFFRMSWRGVRYASRGYLPRFEGLRERGAEFAQAVKEFAKAALATGLYLGFLEVMIP